VDPQPLRQPASQVALTVKVGVTGQFLLGPGMVVWTNRMHMGCGGHLVVGLGQFFGDDVTVAVKQAQPSPGIISAKVWLSPVKRELWSPCSVVWSGMYVRK
jgi:hypothetical protein